MLLSSILLPLPTRLALRRNPAANLGLMTSKTSIRSRVNVLPDLEAMLVSKTFMVPVNPVQNPPSVVTSDQPFFDPGTYTTGLSSGVTVGGTGSSVDQTTAKAVMMREAVNKSATCPVEGPGTDVRQQNATQPVEAPSAGRPPSLLRLPVQVLRFCFPVLVRRYCSLTVTTTSRVSPVP